MPAPPNPYLLFGYSPEPPKKQAIIKVSCGMGDSDGFPALDSESDAYATKDDSKWGFLITGGAEFHMPLTVFQVTPDSLADKAGICLGDIILEINEEDASSLTLTQAHEIIDAPVKKIQFLVRSMEDDENFEQSEEDRSIVLRVPKPMPPPKAAASIEARLVAMQRKLSEISEIPRILSSTLATVSRTFDKLMPGELQQQQANQSPMVNNSGRKFSYDEDAVDYELNDDDDDDDDIDEFGGRIKTGSEMNVEFRFKLRKPKDDTPESDYSSEVEEDVGVDVDEEDTDEDAAEDAYLRNYDDQVEEEDEEDFLSTTYTWNLRNIPKLKLNDNEAPKDSAVSNDDDDEDDDDDATITSNEMKATLTTTTTATTPSMPTIVASYSPDPDANEKQDRMEKFERSWPWADREKIIYKQSTCHLVRRKPLGIVEKRIQLLAKQQIFDKHLRMASNMKQ